MKNALQVVGLVGAWLALFVLFSILAPESFPTLRNVETLMRQLVIVGFASVGMTYIIARGAIDLSVGSVVALVTVVIALALQKGMPPIPAALIGIAAGGVCGLVNGTLTSSLRVGSFIVTLASMLVFRGIAKGLADEKTVVAPENFLSNLTKALGDGERWMLLPRGAWLLILVAALASWAMQHTVFGRKVIATGSNEEAARLVGISPGRMTLSVFLIGGLAAGLAGLLQFSRLAIGDPTVAGGLELNVIAAVVIGGASLTGGTGSIVGSLLGALIMVTISSGSSQVGLPNWIQEIVTGAIIVGAVGIDRWRAHRRGLKE